MQDQDVRTEFPELLQAATKCCSGSVDSLNQWFDDVKKDLLATWLFEHEDIVFGEEGEVVSEVHFKMRNERRIINMDKNHHNLSVTGYKGGPGAVILYHNPLYQCSVVSGVKSARHVTGVYTTNTAGENLLYVYR